MAMRVRRGQIYSQTAKVVKCHYLYIYIVTKKITHNEEQYGIHNYNSIIITIIIVKLEKRNNNNNSNDNNNNNKNNVMIVITLHKTKMTTTIISISQRQ